MVFLFAEDVGTRGIISSIILVASISVRDPRLFFLFSYVVVPLFIVLYFLETIEFLSIKFVQFRVDVFDSVLGAWNDDVFNGIDSPIHNLDDFVEDDESSLGAVLEQRTSSEPFQTYLQASELNESLYSSCVSLPATLYLLPAFP